MRRQSPPLLGIPSEDLTQQPQHRRPRPRPHRFRHAPCRFSSCPTWRLSLPARAASGRRSRLQEGRRHLPCSGRHEPVARTRTGEGGGDRRREGGLDVLCWAAHVSCFGSWALFLCLASSDHVAIRLIHQFVA